MHYLKKIIDLILYGHFWIAAAALVMCWQTQLLCLGFFYCSPLVCFIFFGTLFLYAIHRIVGLAKVRPFQKNADRYFIIARFKWHIFLYACFSGLGALWFFLQLRPDLQLHLLWPCLLAGGYVLPVWFSQKRLRDLHYVKIFLIALVWSWLTVLMPALEHRLHFNIPVYLMCLERFFFIFAITLPFDIRDLEIDAHAQVRTIPGRIGISNTKILAGFLLICMLECCALNERLNVYPPLVLVALLVSALSSFLLIYFSDRSRHDYYFTGLLDGTMILQGAMIWLALP